MTRPKPVCTSVDIETLVAYDSMGNRVGRPSLGITYNRIAVYSPMGKSSKIFKMARAVFAEKGEHYTRDVYARNFQLI
jgi:hypothetical protein